jgi:hypothetical protein
MFFSRQDWRNLSVDNHAMSVTTETATRISMLAKKGSQSLPSSSRSSVWPNGDGENSSGLVNSIQRPGRSSSHHLPSSALSKSSFLSGRTEEVERTTALRALIIARECDKGLEGPPSTRSATVFFELVRYPRLAQSLADCARDKRSTARIKTTLWPCYDQPTPSFLHPSYCNGVAGEVREVVPEAGLPKDTQTSTEESQLRFLPI